VCSSDLVAATAVYQLEQMEQASTASASGRGVTAPKSEWQLSVCLLTKKAKILNALLSVACGFFLPKSHSQLYRTCTER
jgi:hypothetical protein